MLLAVAYTNTKSMTVKNGGCTIVCSELRWFCELAHYISRDCAVAEWDYNFILPFNSCAFTAQIIVLILINAAPNAGLIIKPGTNPVANGNAIKL